MSLSQVELEAGSGAGARAPHLREKPLMRGWSHAGAAVLAVGLTIAFCWASRNDGPRLVSLLIFGLSMIELYSVSATYHMGRWNATTQRRLRALDHANIFVLIAGTYTPICFNALHGWVRVALLVAIWLLALGGITLQLAHEAPRGLSTALYVGMGWVAALALPAFWAALPPLAIITLVVGGALYTVGAVVYGRRWPDPFPRVFGFHEVFHVFVIAGGIAFAVMVWVWVLPFPRV